MCKKLKKKDKKAIKKQLKKIGKEYKKGTLTIFGSRTDIERQIAIFVEDKKQYKVKIKELEA